MAMYEYNATVPGNLHADSKNFKLRGPLDLKDRAWVDLTIETDGRGNPVTLSKIQACVLVRELALYFGINDYGVDHLLKHATAIPSDPVLAPAPRKAPVHGPQEYKGNGKHAIEKVHASVYRLRVPGGWLYMDTYDQGDDGDPEVTGPGTFVPVPDVVGYKI